MPATAIEIAQIPCYQGIMIDSFGNKENRDIIQSASPLVNTFLKDCLIIDFESVPGGDLFHIGALLNGEVFDESRIKSPGAALKKLADFARDARSILGHNIIKHDLALAKAVLPEASFLRLPVMDTLFLSPLAFPENPYHRLVKDYKLVTTAKNNPVADARLAGTVFEDQISAFIQLNEHAPDLISFFAFCFDPQGRDKVKFKGINELFQRICGATPDIGRAQELFEQGCRDKGCAIAALEIWADFGRCPEKKPVLAYVLSWLRVSGGNSIIPPWVKHEFPEVSEIIRKLRYACGSKTCGWCRTHNDAEILLKKYFGFDRYRSLPDGRVLQKEIIETGLSGDSLLGILPTGGGKSICYQIPALHRFERTGALTVIISPLKALMKDQVDNLNRATGTETAAAVNGSLTLPERGAIMEKVRLGDIGLLYISPEQLRNFSINQLLSAREIDCWVFDEAHCLSKWGHDFRPDYLNVANVIARQSKSAGTPPQVAAFTATAKKDVIEEICHHFSEQLTLELMKFEGGVDRTNLSFQVLPVTGNEKFDLVAATLKDGLSHGGAIVYCSSRKTTEELSRFLNERDIPSQPFHAGRSEPDKRNIQDDFTAGRIPVICATNAFGMGIDKKDIRLVIHADIPGSLENYLQEAGRAGRDLNPSDCILLYEQEDIESQFSLNAYSKLSLKDIKKILSVLKKRGAKTPEIVITPGEIMRLIGYTDFAENDARARIGVAWLERKGFVERSFNQTLFFKGAPMVRDLAEAGKKIEALNLSRVTRAVYICLLTTLFNADRDTLLTADTLCASLGQIKGLPDTFLDTRTVMAVLSDMAAAGLIREGVVMTAFVRPKGRDSSGKLLSLFSEMEATMIGLMEERSPEASPDTADIINLRLISQQLKDKGFESANTDTAGKLLRALANDKGDGRGKSLKISGRQGQDQQRVYVNFPWQTLRKRMTLRHQCAGVCLGAIISCLPPSLRAGRAQVLSEFFITDIIKAMKTDIFLSGYKGDAQKLIEAGLLYLHDTKVITLQNGLGIFRQALTLTLDAANRSGQYTKGDYEPLDHHYAQKNVQVHVMEKYASLGIEKIKTALSFVREYFSASHEDFIRQYFPGQEKIIHTAMTAQAYKDIIQSLENHTQEAIVAAPPEKNLLVLAGPGSGKTRTIVHRCAWLIKARSADPSSILVLCFNHQTMIELRKRIKALAGKRADHVTAMTFHGLAMRFTGRSLVEKDARRSQLGFDDFLDEAIDILEGRRIIPGVDQAREYLTARYRYILVDEYQDIDQRQYRFISALTGRLEQDKDARISIMAVGDDDQSIYGFRKANIRFIRQFREDYNATPFFLVENYRSSHPIIQVSNSLIALNRDRMKTDQPGRINGKRKTSIKTPDKIRPKALVRIVDVNDLASQALFVADKILGLLKDRPGMSPEDIAVISRQGISYPSLVALRMALKKNAIPFCYSLKTSAGFPLMRIREIQIFLSFLKARAKESLCPRDLKKEVLGLFDQPNPWTDLVCLILDAWCGITPDMKISLARARDFALEYLLEERQAHKTGTGVFMGTVHSVKGMEFPHVFILDHGWACRDMEEERRLFYVGMTRAMSHLTLCRIPGTSNPHLAALEGHPFIHRSTAPTADLRGFNENLTISILGMEDLYLSYPGRFPEHHDIHTHLAALRTGDKVNLIPQNKRIFIKNTRGQIIGSLSQKGIARWGGAIPSILTARILGIVRRNPDDGDKNTNQGIKSKVWELPIVEILYTR